jgi:uracil-DNA glycosylase
VDPRELPDDLPIAALREAAQACTACPLHADATRTVFGAGQDRARLLLVGEQPGDKEDREGAPFVGPSGRLLDSALEEAGIDRADAYVTNVVKHFKFRQRGKRRIHAKPSGTEIAACRPWLDAELRAVDPEVVVALGATPAKALLGAGFRVTRQRGEVIERDGRRWTATLHPSAILRMPSERRPAAVEDFVDDFRAVARLLR